MYKPERETYYRHLLSIYRIPQELIRGRYNNEVVYIDTDSRMMYNTSGNLVLQFRH